jgi:hypothetical protein
MLDLDLEDLARSQGRFVPGRRIAIRFRFASYRGDKRLARVLIVRYKYKNLREVLGLAWAKG